MATPIEYANRSGVDGAKTKLQHYVGHSSHAHLQSHSSNSLTVHVLTRRQLQNLHGRSNVNTIFAMPVIDGQATSNRIKLVLGGVVEVTQAGNTHLEINKCGLIVTASEQIQSIQEFNAESNSYDDPISISALFLKYPGKKWEDFLGAKMTIAQLTIALHRYMNSPSNNDVLMIYNPDTLTQEKVKGYNIGLNDLDSVDLYNPNGNDSDQFALIPILRFQDANGDDFELPKVPYLSYALAPIVGNVLRDNVREYFNPCPTDCNSYSDFIQ